MPYAEFDGKRYYYAGDAQKDGVPIIFVHGSGGGHHHWLYQIKKLNGNINALAVDLPGHGRSEGEPSNEIPVYRDWLHRFKNAVGLDRFIPAGHSLGGGIALAYALQYPEDTLGLILVGTGGRLRVLPAFLEALREGVLPPAFNDYLYSPEVDEELIERGREEAKNTPASIYYADLSACDKFDIMKELHRIIQPAQVICGSEDRLTPSKYSQFLGEQLPQARVEIIPGAGHMVMIEKPHAVNDTISDFISERFAQESGR